MHHLKNKLMAEIESYEEAAKGSTGEVSDKFIIELSLLINTMYKLCKLDQMLKEEGYYKGYKFKKEIPEHTTEKPMHDHEQPNVFES